MAGGASMFATSGDTLEVGRRNEAAVREALKLARIPVTAADCGGNKGRTLRVYVDQGRVTVRPAGAPESDLLGGAARRRTA
jgi:chemotaxis protein CheD